MLHSIAPLSVKVGLTEKAMLARVTISEWSGRKLDRDVTDEAIKANGAEADAGRFNKSLLPPAAMAKIKEISGKARKEHYARTLPWLDSGARILSNVGYIDYTNTMRQLRGEHADAVAAFIADYPDYVDAARNRLGSMFDESEFPKANELARRFGFDIGILPMPDASDFRVDIGQVEADRIRVEIEERTTAAINEAIGDTFKRVADVVGKMSERLASDREADRKRGGVVIGVETVAQKFNDSLVENVRELAALLPSLNITGNPVLANVAERMKAELCAHGPDELRDAKPGTLRTEVAKAAADILASVSDFMA